MSSSGPQTRWAMEKRTGIFCDVRSKWYNRWQVRDRLIADEMEEQWRKIYGKSQQDDFGRRTVGSR